MDNLNNKYSLNEIKQIISGKKILSIDFGLKRIGLATCDTMHISTAPLTTLQFNEKIIQNLNKIVEGEKIEIVLVGLPKWKNENTDFYRNLEELVDMIEKEIQLPIVFFDEAYSSKRGVELMVDSGKRKKYRKKKENLDKFAAAVILKSFLEELEGV
ncbi:MAG TPA: Holliday junction resolvase RuvX [Candidatus Kapabacteria bacterium]|jgi:putative Holliday junction resolvase|nr:Holliday junction resolvase RuvX [Candidatus Kapabacteria bacterium]HOV91948.1 Holliday junction resolvase RuvX [Candidatus Kapabacteria bacterium]